MSFFISPFLNLLRYNFKVWITQKSVSFSNAKISRFGGVLPFFQVFGNFTKLNTTFFSERDMKRISRWWIIEALEADVSANNIVSFKIRFLIGSDLLSVQLFIINSRTIWTSQVDEYLGWVQTECKLQDVALPVNSQFSRGNQK